jgi:hypothetical protein
MNPTTILFLMRVLPWMVGIMFAVSLGCGIALIAAPALGEFIVDETFDHSSELGSSSECGSYQCIDMSLTDTDCLLFPCKTKFALTGVCVGLSCPCLKTCKTYVQKYRAIATYTLRPNPTSQMENQEVKSYSDYIYNSPEDAMNHSFSREALGTTGWFPLSDRPKSDDTFDGTDVNYYTPASVKQYTNDLSICTGVFGILCVLSLLVLWIVHRISTGPARKQNDNMFSKFTVKTG